MSGGGWRRPRMKVYDYNADFGGNYYQPMIQYINKKDTYGPFHTKEQVYLPHRAEVTSDKFTNLRYNDKSCAHHNLNDFLVNAYSKQIKELNGSTAAVHYNALHGSKDSTPFSDRHLLGGHIAADALRRHYTSELNIISHKERKQLEEARKAVLEVYPGAMSGIPPTSSELDEIRERNRLDRILRAARICSYGTNQPESFPLPTDPIPGDYAHDPMPSDLRDEIRQVRSKVYFADHPEYSQPWLE